MELRVDGVWYDLVVGESKLINEGRTYDILIREGGYEEKISVTIDHIVYSENPNERYIELIINDKYPTYCNYDGNIMRQKTKDVEGNWAE